MITPGEEPDTMSVSVHGSKVRIEYSRPLAWVELTPEWARRLGNVMIQAADQVEGKVNSAPRVIVPGSDMGGL